MSQYRSLGARVESAFNSCAKGVPMGLRPTKTNENAGILRCFRISSLARTFKGAKFGINRNSPVRQNHQTRSGYLNVSASAVNHAIR